MKVLVLEQLTLRTLSRHASVIADADLCVPLSVGDGADAEPVLGDKRWRVQKLPVDESAVARHAAWAHQLMTSQRLDDQPVPARYDSLVCYGLEVRLRPAVLALAYLKQIAADTACGLENMDVRIVADNPYLRDAFSWPGGIAAQVKSVTLRSSSKPATVLSAVKERWAACGRVRSLALASAGGISARVQPSPRSQETSDRKRTAALFVLSQHYLNLFKPIRALLSSRGWRVPVFYYNPIQDPGHDAEFFADAVQHAGGVPGDPLAIPAWIFPQSLLEESPISAEWLRVALAASWLTGWDKICRHHRLLSSLRPDVVISYSIDPMSLGLHGAAEPLGIPSLFINHGPQGPVPWSWFFRWTASALAGQPCVEANTVDPFGEQHKGLVAVGFPPYDAILARAAALGGKRLEIAGLSQPADRPYLVVVFAEYGDRFWVHVLQHRLLRMVAEALPSDCFLLCKLHPAGEHERNPCEKLLASLLPSLAFTFVGEGQYTTPELLAACHVAVAIERCGALTDAIFMGRPGIGLRVPEIPPGSSNLKHAERGPEFLKCCRVVQDKIEMREALVSLTREAAPREAMRANRRRYIESFFVASDGRASHRVADLIEHLGEGKDANSFIPAIGPSLLSDLT